MNDPSPFSQDRPILNVQAPARGELNHTRRMPADGEDTVLPRGHGDVSAATVSDTQMRPGQHGDASTFPGAQGWDVHEPQGRG